MKLLHVRNLYFKLPDDFEGGISAGLRALADYHDQVDGTPKQVHATEENDDAEFGAMTLKDFEERIYTEFWDMIHTSDRRHRGHLCVCDLDTWQAEEQGGPKT